MKQLINIEEIASKIVAAAIRVHIVLGPGLLESAYQKCLQYELQKDNLSVACEVALPVVYDRINIDARVLRALAVNDFTLTRFML